MTKTGDTGTRAQRSFERVAEGEEGIFGGVVTIDYEKQSAKAIVVLIELVPMRSPLHRKRKLQPACFAQACNM